MSLEKRKTAKTKGTRKRTVHGSRQRTISMVLSACLLVLSAVVTGAFILNILNVNSAETGTEEDAVAVNTDKSMKNSQYVIGNNPTDIEKTYFQELSDAVKANDDAAICEAVVKSFVTEYFTWTNKDGNYEVGGLQYIYGSKYPVFEEWSRYNYYSDLDLYISQYGRDNLLQVKEVTLDKPVEKAPDFATAVWISDTEKQDILFDSYEVNVSWTYENCKLNTSDFVSGARFFLVNNEGRWEIAEFYDYDSIHEWEVENGLASENDAERSLS